ncbi:hypothetical protein Cme02nite_48900 [Catellatospora methionotrophica]|uniref:Uncharacterized protein n=1 Tax=Catellatospora methionotrophica TaxID=121620 RepID=A0A8J3LE19_9ACTN|nr:hypothetical protein [Catellatospora methionotrophica]GIG16558.1 hypothetical protein Cme02nite_48900 [Catellatospora methionotrophica]
MNRRIVTLALLLALTGCDPGNETPSAAETAQALAPGQVRHEVGVTFQYGSLLATVGDAVYDQQRAEYLLAVRYRNIGDAWADSNVLASLRMATGAVPMTSPGMPRIPPRAVAEVTYTAQAVSADPTTGGRVVFGGEQREQAAVALDGAPSAVFTPTAQPLDVWLRNGKYTVHVTRARVLAGSIGALNQQAEPGRRVLRLDFDLFAHRFDPVNGFFPQEHLLLVPPGGGEPIQALDTSAGVIPRSWTLFGGNWADFPVPAAYPGDYRLRLSSVSTKGFATFHPDKIVYATAGLTIGAGAPSDAPGPDLPTPVPVLGAQPSAAVPSGFDVAVTTGTVNVPGFAFTPRRLRYDPTARTATLDGEARYLTSDNADSTSPLYVPPQFTFNVALVDGGRYHPGSVTGGMTVATTGTTPVTLRFDAVDRLAPDSAALLVGPSNSMASSLPLGDASTVPPYPTAVATGPVTAPPIVAGDWTVQVTSYRLGLLSSVPAPAPGTRQLELRMTVTCSPAARARALGLVFRPAGMVFLLATGGYLTQLVADGGIGDFQPGQTQELSVLFSVPDSFTPARLGLTVRGVDEVADLFTDKFAETTGGIDLGAAGAGEDLS